MAKWGEGDPRWIVEERADAKNVNNWHWTEKNATVWSKSRITELLVGLSDENENFHFEICSVSKIEGEAVANNRKGKLIFFYEWDIEAEWKGYNKSDSEKEYSGKVSIPNLSEENSANELEISVSCSKSSKNALVLKEFIRTESAKKIRVALGKYIDNLVLEYSKDLILPSKIQTQSSNEINNLQSSLKDVTVSNKSVVNHSTETPKMPDSGAVKLRDFDLSEIFYCNTYDLYKVLTTPEAVKAFSRSEVVLNPTPQGSFSLFNGEVLGKFIELDDQNHILKMQWRKKKWPDYIYSDVTMTIVSHSEGSELLLSQRGVPYADVEDTKQGWKMHYFNAIKQTFGFGKIIF